jgi:hypothetical protein
MGSYPSSQNPPPYSTYPPMGPTLTTMQPGISLLMSGYYGHGQNIPYGTTPNPGYYSGAPSPNSGYQPNSYQMNSPYGQPQGQNQLQPPNKYGPIATPYNQAPQAGKPQYGASGGQPQQQQSQQPQYMQNPQYGMPPAQNYNNPNYQYYIGNNGQTPK